MTGWAILGTGAVSEQFVTGMKFLGGAEKVITVASRDPSNARAFAAYFGGEATDYTAAVTNRDVGAVYIATPPALHEDHALLAINAGKGVLIEKPFATDVASATRIVSAARAAGVFCMEAMWTRFTPMIAKVRGHIASGVLGEIRSFEGSFMGSDLPDVGVSLFDPDRGGGALAHRGIYPLSLARMLLGPAELISAAVRFGETGVDEDCTLVLRHQSGVISTLIASLRAPGSNRLIISGTMGMLEVSGPIWRPYRAKLTTVMPRTGGAGGGRRHKGKFAGLRASFLAHKVQQRLPAGLLKRGKGLFCPYSGNGYHYEIAEVTSCLNRGKLESPMMPLDETIDIMRLSDAARAAFRRDGEQT